MHSKPKLALAILTSPGAAFEEILERGLLGTAILITVLTGIVAAITPLIYGLSSGPVHYFLFGKYNPVCWLGLCMLYAFLLSKLLTWIGTEISFTRMLTIMGWAQILLLLVQIATIAGDIMILRHVSNQSVASLIDTAKLGFSVWYVVAIGMGVRTATGAPLSRGILTYTVIAFAAMIAFGITYQMRLFNPFANALPGVAKTAGVVISADQSPWLAAGVLGLAIGLWQLSKVLGWDKGTVLRAVASVAVVGAVVLGLYVRAVWADSGYYMRIVEANRTMQKAERLYENHRADWLEDAKLSRQAAGSYAKSARQFEAILPMIKDNYDLHISIGDLYYLAGDSKAALRHYDDYRKGLASAATTSETEDQLMAPLLVRIGTVQYFDGKYDDAAEQFKKAADRRPKFRDAWVRLAVAYNRMGEYDKALIAAQKAVKTLKSKAVVGRIAYAQALARTGRSKDAKEQIDQVTEQDEELAERIGESPANWLNAVDKLTRNDLRFPLEAEPEPKPEQAKPKPKQK